MACVVTRILLGCGAVVCRYAGPGKCNRAVGRFHRYDILADADTYDIVDPNVGDHGAEFGAESEFIADPSWRAAPSAAARLSRR